MTSSLRHTILKHKSSIKSKFFFVLRFLIYIYSACKCNAKKWYLQILWLIFSNYFLRFFSCYLTYIKTFRTLRNKHQNTKKGKSSIQKSIIRLSQAIFLLYNWPISSHPVWLQITGVTLWTYNVLLQVRRAKRLKESPYFIKLYRCNQSYLQIKPSTLEI